MSQIKNQMVIRLLLVIVGAVLAAIGLELFLIPHTIIVGGVTGVSAIFAYFTEIRIGFFLFLFNLPFILLSYHSISKQFVSITVFSLFIFALSAIFLHPFPSLIEDAGIAAMLGGILLGGGIGLVVRFGGSLDATENTVRSASPAMLSSVLRIKVFNTLILLGAGFVFGWSQALYSTVAYLLAVEMVGLTLQGFSFKRTIWIRSTNADEIYRALKSTLNMQISYVPNDYTDLSKKEVLLSATIHLFEISRIKSIVIALDPDASFHTR